MNPETRAARDRLARFAGSDFQAPPLDLPTEVNCLTIAEVKKLVTGAEEAVREAITPDLLTVLAALDQHEAHLEAVRQDIRQVAAEAGFSPVPDRVQITYGMPPKTDTQRMVELYLNPPGMPYGSTPHPKTSDQSSQEGAP